MTSTKITLDVVCCCFLLILDIMNKGNFPYSFSVHVYQCFLVLKKMIMESFEKRELSIFKLGQILDRTLIDYHYKRYYDADIEELEYMYMLDYYLWEHKENYGKALTQDLFRDYHQKMFSKALREELMPIAWHPNRWWDWCVPEDEKRELEAWFVK